MKRLAKINLPIIFSGPFSYSAAAVETVFAHLKLGDLNPEKLPTGKKSVSYYNLLTNFNIHSSLSLGLYHTSQIWLVESWLKFLVLFELLIGNKH